MENFRNRIRIRNRIICNCYESASLVSGRHCGQLQPLLRPLRRPHPRRLQHLLRCVLKLWAAVRDALCGFLQKDLQTLLRGRLSVAFSCTKTLSFDKNEKPVCTSIDSKIFLKLLKYYVHCNVKVTNIYDILYLIISFID